MSHKALGIPEIKHVFKGLPSLKHFKDHILGSEFLKPLEENCPPSFLREGSLSKLQHGAVLRSTLLPATVEPPVYLALSGNEDFHSNGFSK